MSPIRLGFLLGAAAFCAACASPEPHGAGEARALPVTSSALTAARARTVELDARGVRIDGRYTLLRGGSVQWFRIPEEAWEDRLARYAAAGFNALDIYVAWNEVEPEEGVFDFDKPNLARFLALCAQHGLYVAIRPGPFITNEMDGGGLPAWLLRKATKKSLAADGLYNIRTADPDFIAATRRYFEALNEVIEPYLATRGGPVVLYTIENEYTWFERAHGTDKLFWYQGGPERPWQQELDVRAYMTALRDIVRESGVDIPIVSCPGDGAISAMGDVPDVAPFPNIYEWATPKQPEQAAHDVIAEMHDPAQHGGVYVNMPSGSMEVARSAQEFRRLFMGGLDVLFGFNMAGMIQEGYLNSVTLAARANDEPPHWGPPGQPQADWLSTIFAFDSIDDIVTGGVAPQFGYFHNVLDYQGAISPSGAQRKLLYEFRRDNMFYDSVQELMGGAGQPRRSGEFAGADPRLHIADPELGTREADDRKVHYWLEAEDQTAILSVLNQSGAPRTLARGALRFRDTTFPRFSDLVVPTAEEPNNTYAQLLVHGLRVADETRIAYTTSELLTLRDFDEERLLVLYGIEGTTGELSLRDPEGTLQIVHRDASVQVHEHTRAALTVTYPYGRDLFLVLQNARGKTLRVLVTTRAQAGRFWFVRAQGHDVLLAGPDMVYDEQGSGALRYEFGASHTELTLVSRQPFTVSGVETISAHDARTGVSRLRTGVAHALPELAPLLAQGVARADLAEADPSFDDSAWTSWQGEPLPLEDVGIARGHAWYRAELTLERALGLLNRGRLYVEHAGDIVGMYVNGHYLSTVAPAGTEIDNTSLNRHYQFASAKPFLKQGRNVLAFRTESWGHGSFMFGRGKLLATQAQLPSVGYEGLKGLHGEASVAGFPLSQWRVRAELGGERAGYARPEHDEAGFVPASIPMQLTKGDVRWYRTSFRSEDLPPAEQVFAPVVCELKGARSKATIFLNGRLIGRWLSDSEWLQHGVWARPMKSMWSAQDPDHFPLPRELLRSDGEPNVLAVVFEDASRDSQPAGTIDVLRLRYNDEKSDWNGNTYERGIATETLGRLQLTPR